MKSICEGNGGGIRLYGSARARAIAIARLRTSGVGHFTRFQDADGECPFGLSFGRLGGPKEGTGRIYDRRRGPAR